MMFLLLGVIILPCYGRTIVSIPATYDQRQSGDVNVQIQLKDVQIITVMDTDLLEDYANYDYAYDYADFTVKPIIKPTVNSSISTDFVKPWNTWPTIAPSVETTAMISNASEIISLSPQNQSMVNVNATSFENQNNTLASSVDEGNATKTPLLQDGKLPVEKNVTEETRIDDKIGNPCNDENVIKVSIGTNSSTETSSVEQQSTKRCQPGYSRNKAGRCRHIRRRISLIPLAVQLAPKLAQKLSNIT